MSDTTFYYEGTSSGSFTSSSALIQQSTWTGTVPGGTNLTRVEFGSAVTEIANYAFSHGGGVEAGYLTEISFENSTGLTEIGVEAFSYSGLETINPPFPASLTVFGTEVFAYCYSLTDYYIPTGISAIPGSMYKGCNLTSVTIPNWITSIGTFAFDNLTNLTELTFASGSTLKTIDEYAFGSAYLLETVILPNSITAMNEGCFGSCYLLTTFAFPPQITKVSNSVLSYCYGLESVLIPPGVTEISNSAFQYCTSLTSVTIPSAVAIIGSSAFSNTTSLDEIIFDDAGAITSVPTSGVFPTQTIAQLTYHDATDALDIPQDLKDSISTATTTTYSGAGAITYPFVEGENVTITDGGGTGVDVIITGINAVQAAILNETIGTSTVETQVPLEVGDILKAEISFGPHASQTRPNGTSVTDITHTVPVQFSVI